MSKEIKEYDYMSSNHGRNFSKDTNSDINVNKQVYLYSGCEYLSNDIPNSLSDGSQLKTSSSFGKYIPYVSSDH